MLDSSITALPNAIISFPLLGENFVFDPPRYISIFGFHVYLYGIIIALGFVLAVLYCLRRSREFGLTNDNVLDLVLCAIPSAVVGARIFYVLANPERYFTNGNWVDIFKIREGGLAIYGGLILAVLVICVYSRIKKIPIGRLLDVAALGVMIGQVIGRWGNFINRELFGRETDIFCRMGLTVDGVTYYVHPTFLYESLWNLIGFVILHFYSKKHRKFEGQMFVMYAAWYGFGRTFIDGLRLDERRIFGDTMAVWQFIALITFCAAALFLIIKLSKLQGAPALSYNTAPDDRNSVAPAPIEDLSDTVTDNSENNSDDNTSDGDVAASQRDAEDEAKNTVN